jgi:hypothetical protein
MYGTTESLRAELCTSARTGAETVCYDGRYNAVDGYR